MKRILFSLFALVLSVGMSIPEAEAKRLGSGKSIGMQRDSTPQSPASPPARTADAPSPGMAGAAAAAPKKNSWLGPVAGLAAGLGLAALASHLGFGEEMANIMMIALMVMAALVVFRLIMRKRQPAAGMQYAGMGAGGGGTVPQPFQPAPMGGSAGVAPVASRLPADFDAEGFLRQAKLNFLRLQAANDAGNLDDLREFTTPEMFAELQLQIGERGKAAQSTEVMDLQGEVLECVEDGDRYVVSVRFNGLIREEQGAPAESFDEVWHLTKPVRGSRGWAVAGIQQR